MPIFRWDGEFSGAGLHRCGFWHFRMPSCWGLQTSLLRMRVVSPEKHVMSMETRHFLNRRYIFFKWLFCFTIVILVFRGVPKKSLKNYVIVGVVFQRVPFFLFVVQAINDSMTQSVFFEPSQTDDVIPDYNLPN